MEAVIRFNGRNHALECEETETALYRAVSEWMAAQVVPIEFEVVTPIGSARYAMRERREDDKGTTDIAKMHLCELENRIGLPSSTYEKKVLTCVRSEANNYKVYKFLPERDGIWAEYGRMGEGSLNRIRRPYPTRLFWLLYQEKLMKGYVDRTDVYLDETVATVEEDEEHEGPGDEPEAATLYDLLFGFARARVRHSLTQEHVTVAQARASRALVARLGEAEGVEEFNATLLELFAICQRRVPGFKERGVASLLAGSEADFARIIEREEDLVQAMEGVAGVRTPREERTARGSFTADGVGVRLATDEERAHVLSKLSRELVPKALSVYRIESRAHRARFDEYVANRGITDVRSLWHGSRNENWLSIIKSGLLLNPNAIITGKMFGNGIYFAPSSRKSFNYTSYLGSYWARGSSSTGIMGLYSCAYGDPHDVDSPGSWSADALAREGKDCIHAHAGSYLMNDEIVFYDEAAMCLEYLVVFS